jgi:glycine cleavage system H lipoate-binding protein
MVALTVILLIIGFMLLDLAIQYLQKPKTVEALSAATSRIAHAADELMADFLMPLGYFFHPGHTWARIQETGEILVGIDDFAHKALGKIDRISLPEVGQQVDYSRPAFQLYQGGKHAAFVAPVSGTVLEVNNQLQSSPTLLDDNPYGSGWLMKIKPSHPTEEFRSLFIADSARQWLKNEIRSFRDFLMEIAGKKSELGMTLADGGIPIKGVMEEFGDKEWNNFQEHFLKAKAA